MFSAFVCDPQAAGSIPYILPWAREQESVQAHTWRRNCRGKGEVHLRFYFTSQNCSAKWLHKSTSSWWRWASCSLMARQPSWTCSVMAMQQYLLTVLSCIYPITTEAVYLFKCLLAIWFPLVWTVCWKSLPMFLLDCLSFLIFMGSTYILDTEPLWEMCIANILSGCGLSFKIFYSDFYWFNVLNFNVVKHQAFCSREIFPS